MQQFLNRRTDQLWGFVSNGLLLRLLRDNASLTRQAFVEFDLEAMMDGEVYADFALLWLVCHQSRVEAEKAAECWLERWVQKARDQGARALDRLRSGVETTIAALGRGFLAHPKNSELREELRSGALDKQDYYRELLRLVYRLLFLLVAEDRGLLLDPNAKPDAKSRYRDHYSTERLRRLVARRRGGPHPDGWRALRLVMAKLGDDAGCPDLALPPLGSFLWSRAAVPHLADAELANEHLFEAVRALAFTESDRLLRPVDWRNLDSEELGSIYESLLELHPEVDAGAAHFELSSAAGHERKTTGSYYTPDSLVQCLLDTALEPVLAEACKRPNPEQALLDLKVCDPACGSGHFLIAAARRIARRLAQVRSGDADPDPSTMQTAVRDVIGHCMYGVDVNPMAVELCKVSLWLEAIEPGKPLSFLDHQMQCGNSLLGTTPALLANGVPDEAFDPIEGDDKKVASALRRRNRAERKDPHAGKQEPLFISDTAVGYGAMSTRAARFAELADNTIEAIHNKEEAYRALESSAEWQHDKLLADAWCAAFVWQKTEGSAQPPTHAVVKRLPINLASVPSTTRAEIERLGREYSFFHWHLAFPEVFEDGQRGGFDVVLSNPPWERVKLQEKEFFATRLPEIASAQNAAARRRLIAKLAQEDESKALYGAFLAARRRAEGESHLVRDSGRYPLCGRGDVNTYAVFAELMRDSIGSSGRVGCIVPSGIATDDTTKHFFQSITERQELVSLYDFQTGPGLFSDIGHARFKLCLLTLSGSSQLVRLPEFAFFLRAVDQLAEPDRRFHLSAEDIALLNPNTRTCPVFRSHRDAELTKAIYGRVPVFVREGPPEENPWGASFMSMFHMSNDSEVFRTRHELEADGWILVGNIFEREGERLLPLYEAKMAGFFDHRAADVVVNEALTERQGQPVPLDLECHQDPNRLPIPRSWVPEVEVETRLANRWNRDWLLGWRDITHTTNERTVMPSVIPRTGVGNSLPISLLDRSGPEVAGLVSCISSFVFDFVSRFKVGGVHLNFFITSQLPVSPPDTFATATPWHPDLRLGLWIKSRVLELTYTAWDLEPWAKDLGWDGPPFRWDESRRFLLRCELDAAFFHLYAINRDDTAYILDTFPIVRRKDEQAHGEYRTKRVIIEIFDALQRAIDTGVPYQTHLDPPPADPRCCHGSRSIGLSG